MKAPSGPRFLDQKNGFSQIFSDRHWLAKIALAGFLLINPFLVALAPAYFSPDAPVWVKTVFPWILGCNVLTFWFPLGFTFEVLRRARTGQGSQLPPWSIQGLATFAYEGSVKLRLAVTTLLLPTALWMGFCDLLFVRGFGLPVSLLSLFVPPIMLLVIPFCGVACCRWLDGASMASCALNYAENWRLFRRGWKDYLIASAFIVGVNSITTSFFYTIPFGAVFGLCLVDTWFGPIYAATVEEPTFHAMPARKNESVYA